MKRNESLKSFYFYIKKILFVLGTCPYVGQVLGLPQDCNITTVIENIISLVDFFIDFYFSLIYRK